MIIIYLLGLLYSFVCFAALRALGRKLPYQAKLLTFGLMILTLGTFAVLSLLVAEVNIEATLPVVYALPLYGFIAWLSYRGHRLGLLYHEIQAQIPTDSEQPTRRSRKPNF